MQKEFTKNRKKILFKERIPKLYDWFSLEFLTTLKTASDDFLEKELRYKLVSISEDHNLLYTKEPYFVSNIKIAKEQAVAIRLSKDAVDIFLGAALGKSNKNFDLSEMSEIEQKILLAFNDFLYKRVQKSLKLPKTREERNNLKDLNAVNLIFFVKNNAEKTGKIILSLPIAALEPKELLSDENNSYNFNLMDFKASKTLVDIKVGSSKINLQDVKNLESDDIIVLDKSDPKKMELVINNQKIEIKVSPDPSLMMGLNDDGGDEMEHNNMEIKDVWDSIQVEIKAEFEKVNISLGELKQISEGLVVDISSVFDNKVNLKVENRVIASGELVIINDRYGVKVDKIFKEEKQTASVEAQAPKAVKEQTIEPPIQAEEEISEEDFDYSDFDIEDENI